MKTAYFFLCLSALFFARCEKESVAPPPAEVECNLQSEDEGLVQDISDNFAYAFGPSDPEQADPALSPLVDYLGEAHFVGLGEATHGTADFYEMKDKLFRALVTEKGFKAIVFEIPWGNALVVNDYVLNGIGTADDAVNQTFYWTYDTEEVRALVRWMRAYNDNRPAAEKIHFVGCDPQGGNFLIEMTKVRELLEQAQPDSTEALMARYAELPQSELSDYNAADPELHQRNVAGVEYVVEYLENQRAELISIASEFQYEVALMAAHLIRSREYIYRLSSYGEDRDLAMAKYAEWWQRILAVDARIAIWAHSNHVMDGSALGVEWMGNGLKRRHGDDYRILGFSFTTGSFNAFLQGIGYQFAGPVQRQSIVQPDCATTNFILQEVAGDRHYLIFDELTGETATYFRTPQAFTIFGAGFNSNFIGNYTRPMPLARIYDALMHFDETRASELR